MRLFVGIELDATVATPLAALSSSLRARAAALAPRAAITWVPAERLHITVRFIGNSDENRMNAIKTALGPSLAHPAFDAVVSGVGIFPAKGPPRVIWAGIAEGRDDLRHVEREVSTRLERAGVPAEDRDYSAHITLARVRHAAGLRAAPLAEGIEHGIVGTTRVSAATLFDSRLSPKGPTYVVMHRTLLQNDSRTPDALVRDRP